MVEIGMKVKFIPAIVPAGILPPAEKKLAAVVGTVVYINSQHKYFAVEYACGNTKQRENFKFSEIGQAVTICGH